MEGDFFTFCLPDIGEGVVEGEVIEWLKKEGDQVKQDEPVVVVMTDKATVELPAPYPGIIQKTYYQPGEVAIKGKPLYDIQVEKKVSTVALEQKPEESLAKDQLVKEDLLQVKGKVKNKEGDERDEKTKAIPRVRHEAQEWEIDLTQVVGSGPSGRVEEEDLHRFLNKQDNTPISAHKEGDQEQKLVGVRGLMAKKMHETRIPQFSYFEQSEVTRLIQLRQKIKEKASKEGIQLSYMPFFIRALSLTIHKFPQINASLDMQLQKVFFHKQHNVGIAMTTSQGLIVPVLKAVETMGLVELIKAYEALKARILAGSMSSSDMKGATITISNFGVLQGEGMWATPLISHPEVAILALARIRKIPVVKGEEIVIRDVLPLSWSFDHRWIDGELAANISHYYSTLLREPSALL